MNVYSRRLIFGLLTSVSGVFDSWAENRPPELAVLEKIAHTLESEADLDPLLLRIGDARWVLLGEASHGTSEYYTWRAAITRRLIGEQGFRIVAVEGDWAALYRLNRYVKHMEGAGESARTIMQSFSRWPVWMWANEETADLIEWMRAFNRDRPLEDRAGFYGMDVYGEDLAFQTLLESAMALDPSLADTLAAWYECYRAYEGDMQAYVRALSEGDRSCAAPMTEAHQHLRELLEVVDESLQTDYFALSMKAKVLRNAERHYRLMRLQGPHSWNARVDHFHGAVERLMEWYGPSSRAVVWAHNTHIGDARATSMARLGQRNIGQLARERNTGEGVVAVGFGSHRGTVQAGRAWGEPMETMPLPPALPASLEDLMHQLGKESALFILSDAEDPAPLRRARGHRAVGVVYRPEQEQGNYVPTVFPSRYDAFIFIDETTALRPVM